MYQTVPVWIAALNINYGLHYITSEEFRKIFRLILIVFTEETKWDVWDGLHPFSHLENSLKGYCTVFQHALTSLEITRIVLS